MVAERNSQILTAPFNNALEKWNIFGLTHDNDNNFASADLNHKKNQFVRAFNALLLLLSKSIKQAR